VGALDTIWAEDGTIFLTGAFPSGVWDALWSPYAGYAHLVPRALAEVAVLFPTPWAAAVMAIEAALLTALMALLVFHASSCHLQGLVRRLVAAAPVVGVPLAQGDLPNAVANLHWPALYVVFWMLLWIPRGPVGVAVSAAALGLTAGSDVLVVVFVPLAVVRLWMVRSWRGWVPVGALAAGLAAQVSVRLLNDASRDLAPELDPVRLAGGVAGRLVPLSLMGERWAGMPGASAQFLLAAATAWAAVVAVLWVSRRGGDGVDLAVVAAGHALVLYLLPSMATGVFTARYAVAPAMLLLVAGAALLGPAQLGARPGRVVAAGVGGLLLVVVAVNLRVDNQRADGPSWSTMVDNSAAQCEDSRTSVVLPISPRGWTARVPCSDLP
jgi:hypothetical protein